VITFRIRNGSGIRIAPYVVIVVCLVIFFRQFFFQGKVPVQGDWLATNFLPWRAVSEASPPYNPELDDPILSIYPFKVLAAEMMKQGILPLWNPYILCGTPLLADGITDPFSPFSVFFFILPAGWATAMSYFTHLLVAALGMYLLLRAFSVGRFGALVGALAYGLNGTFVVWLELRILTGTFCWMPLVFLAMKRYADSGRLSYAGWVSVLLAFQFLSGSPQFSLYLLILTAAYGLYVFFSPGGREAPGPSFGRPRTSVAVVAGLVVLLGIGLAGVQLLPTAELALQSQRATPRYTGGNYLHPLALLTFVFPELFGHPVEGNYVGAYFFGRSFLAMHGGYVGVLPLILAVVGAVFSRNRLRPFLLVSGGAVLVFLVALGSSLFHRLILAVLPGLDGFDMVRMLPLYEFSFAGLSALGADVILKEGDKPFRSRVASKVGVAIAAGVIVFLSAGSLAGIISRDRLAGSGVLFFRYLAYLQQGWKPIFLDPQLLVSSAVLLGCLLIIGLFYCGRMNRGGFVVTVVLLTALDLLAFGTKYNPFVEKDSIYPETGGIVFLEADTSVFRMAGIDPPGANPFKGDLLPPNTCIPYGLHDVRGKASLYPGRYNDLMTLATGIRTSYARTLKDHRSPILDLLNLKYFLFAGRRDDPDLKLEYDGEMKVYRNERALSRAFLVSSLEVAESKGELFSKLCSAEFDPRKGILVERNSIRGTDLERAVWEEEARAESRAGGARESGGKRSSKVGEAIVEKYAPNEVIVSARAAAAAYLVLSDTYYPGWKAYVNRIETPIYPAYHALRFVRIPPGESVVRFVYRPGSFRYGAYASAVAACIVGFLFVLGMRQARRA